MGTGRGSNPVRGYTGESGDNRRGNVKPLPLAGQTAFNSGNETSVDRTVDRWEGQQFARKNERLLMVDDRGYAVAYFDGDRNSVAFQIPPAWRQQRGESNAAYKERMQKLTITHVHPIGDDRAIGGPFSEADLNNHIRFNFGETRATSVEGTYFFRAGNNPDAKGFQKALDNMRTETRAAKERIFAEYQKRGQTITPKQKNDIWLETVHAWYTENAPKYGYVYGRDNRKQVART